MNESTKEIAEATKAVATTAGKAIDAGREAGGFIAQIIKEPLLEVAALFTDKIKYKRQENIIDLEIRLKRKIAALNSKYTLKEIPMVVAVPLLEAASLEELEHIRDTWANLCLNFSNSQSEVLPSRAFVDALSSMSPFEALIFNSIYSTPDANKSCILTGDLPDIVKFETIKKDGSRQIPKEPSSDVALAIANLFRTQCLQTAKYMGGPDVYSTVYTTVFGAKLFEACTDRTIE